MSYFDQAPGQEAAQLNRAALAPATPDDMAATMFGGIPTALTNGVRSAVYKAQSLAEDAAIPLAAEIDKRFGTSAEQWVRTEAATTQARVRELRPDPYVVGGVGRALGGLAEILPLFAAGTAAGGPAGGAALAGTVEGYAGVKQGLQEGLDQRTALAKGVIEGAAVAAGAFLPMSIAGAPLWKSVGFGVGVNVLFGAENRGLTSSVLERAGYPDQAAQYRALDKAGLAADAILGTVFGLWGHATQAREATGAPRPAAVPGDAPGPAAVDAAMVAKSEIHQRDVAGIAADVETANIVTAKVADETMAMLSGEPRQAPPVDPAALHMVEDPKGSPAQVRAALDELQAEQLAEAPAPFPPPGERLTYEPARDLTPDERAVEQRLGLRPVGELIAEYSKLEDSEGGKVLNTDVARELSPEYLRDRSGFARAVHEPMSGLIKRIYAQKLAEPPKPGEEPVVLFTAGGTGAGKTSGLAGEPALAALKEQAQIVYDTNMNGYTSAKAKIDQALEAGKEVVITHVYREPVEALVKGALSRAMKQVAKYGSGRSVPLAEHAKTHTGSIETVLQLAREYAGDERVQFRVLDNSRGRGKQALADLDFLASKVQDNSVLREQLRQALEDEKAKGSISEAVYRGFRQGEPAATTAETPGAGGQDGSTLRPNDGGKETRLEPAASGRVATVKIGDAYEKVTWAVVDAGDIAPSMAKGENQARDRNRAASEAQIAKIAGALDFNLLADAPIMDFGAPTLAADGRIVGGNGRVAAVARAYAEGGAEPYREQLIAAAGKFGLDPAQFSGLDRPVLVRVLEPGVNVRQAAIASNEGAGMKMSLLEQAPVDAERLPPLAGFYVPEDGNLNAAANRDFIMNWIGKFPGTEQAALVDAAGALSQEGMIRLRNAVLLKAYGDSPTLARMVELADPGAKNVGNALVKAGPPVAAARDAIARGDLHPVDPLPDLLAAVEKFGQLKEEGTRIADFMNQGELMGPSLTPEARQILAFLDSNARSARAMSDMIAGMYRELERAGNPKEGDFFGAVVPKVADLVDAGIREADGPGILSGSLFDAADAHPGEAGSPRSKESTLHEAQSRADQAEAEAPLFDTAVNCAKAA